VQLELSLESLPLADGVREVASALGVGAAELAATAGEDYELCVCAPPSARRSIEMLLGRQPADGGLSWIGTVTEGSGAVTFAGAEGPLSGYEHLS
jgi:thiamine-monophosphate kinase